MSLHPLVDLAAEPEVRKAAGFRAVAVELTGEALAERYGDEVSGAPRRHDANKRYLVAYNSRLAASRRPGRDGEHLALALVEHCRAGGAGLALPDDEGQVEFLHAQLPLRSAPEDRSKGDQDPNRGVGSLDLLGVGPEGRMVVGKVKYLAPSASRGGTGDTPLRALLEGLLCAAIATANREALQKEIDQRGGAKLSEEPPILVILGSPRYWELCRRREAQKGAAWIKELERLGQEVEQALGVRVRYLACRLDGDPGWSYPEGRPVLDEPPRLAPAWEPGAGRVRPRARPRPKLAVQAETRVEPDLSRPVRSYAFDQSYAAGDRIEHPTLGLGVVQGVAGNGKITVLFGERKSLLVHERPASGGAPASPPSD